MALITAKYAVNLSAIDLHDLVTGSPPASFLDNTRYTSPQNVLYEDVIRYDGPGSPNTQVQFGGTSLAIGAGGAGDDSDGTGIGASLQFAQFDAGTKIVLGGLFII